MQRIEALGPFHYEIEGNREIEAAIEFENALDFIYRNYHNPFTRDDIADTIRDVSKKYGVNIKSALD